jgi:hypothetical protein
LQHAYRDGRLEEVALRHLGAADGDTIIAKDIRFLYLYMVLCLALCTLTFPISLINS